jgi:hypothetical protein
LFITFVLILISFVAGVTICSSSSVPVEEKMERWIGPVDDVLNLMVKYSEAGFGKAEEMEDPSGRLKTEVIVPLWARYKLSSFQSPTDRTKATQ